MCWSGNVKSMLLKKDWLLAQIKEAQADKNIMQALEKENSWGFYFCYSSSFVDNS